MNMPDSIWCAWHSGARGVLMKYAGFSGPFCSKTMVPKQTTSSPSISSRYSIKASSISRRSVGGDLSSCAVRFRGILNRGPRSMGKEEPAPHLTRQGISIWLYGRSPVFHRISFLCTLALVCPPSPASLPFAWIRILGGGLSGFKPITVAMH
jgi:hypothetical protein